MSGKDVEARYGFLQTFELLAVCLSPPGVVRIREPAVVDRRRKHECAVRTAGLGARSILPPHRKKTEQRTCGPTNPVTVQMLALPRKV